MKLKHLAFTLLICLIGFAGFSLTTTDPCQDSNLEVALSADVGEASFQGVVDLSVLNDLSTETTQMANGIKPLQTIKFSVRVTDIDSGNSGINSQTVNYTNFKNRLARDGINHPCVV